MSVSDSDSDAMVRWQAYARESRTAANSHFLAYSAATIALQTSVIIDNEVKKVEWPCLFIAAGLFAVLALLIGSVVVLVRLRDARLTARVARYRHESRPRQQIEEMRKKANVYSGWTNKLLPLQIVFFSLSAVALVIWVVGAHAAKFYGAEG